VICLLQTSHWQPGIDRQVCSYNFIKASTRDGLQADVCIAPKQSLKNVGLTLALPGTQPVPRSGNLWLRVRAEQHVKPHAYVA
jgi:hypothetical protein